MQTLLKSVHDYRNPTKNPSARFSPVPKRVFRRDRSYAILLGLLERASECHPRKQRARAAHPAGQSRMAGQEDEGWLFISEAGGRTDEGRFLKPLKKITAFAGVSDHILLTEE